ncbi:MAG TPA: GntR family transcriptional regulator [Stellaceae bacterium]|nr:GntR family transcriptional regulator [Stellaceae bacterium]
MPIYVQLREQILHAIGDGTLKPGARLPTMREVAVALKIDLNTVQRAYAALEREGVLTTLRGRGTFVADAPPPVDPSLRAATVEGLAQRTIATAHSLGLDPREVARLMLTLANAPTAEP